MRSIKGVNPSVYDFSRILEVVENDKLAGSLPFSVSCSTTGDKDRKLKGNKEKEDATKCIIRTSNSSGHF